MQIGSGRKGSGAGGTFVASAPLGGQRGVRTCPDGRIDYASASHLDHYECVLGLTRHAADADAPIAVQWGGEMRDPSFAGRFTAGPVWLGEDGVLVQDAPDSGFMQRLGLFVPPDRLIVGLGEPVLLTSD